MPVVQNALVEGADVKALAMLIDEIGLTGVIDPEWLQGEIQRDDVRACLACGCTNEMPCIDAHTGERCSWVFRVDGKDADICTHCQKIALAVIAHEDDDDENDEEGDALVQLSVRLS